MKKIYIKPCLASMAIRINHSLLAASGSVTDPVVIPTIHPTIIEDETAEGNESLSRLNRDDWDVEEYEEEEEDF